MTADRAALVERVAYRFWSIHPKDRPEPVGMPEGFPGGARAWFYATEMKAMCDLIRADALEEAARVVEMELSYDYDESTRVAATIRNLKGD